jgi:hypothetical protein
MRTIRVKGVWLSLISAVAVGAVACGPTYTHPDKKMSREDVAIDVLDCQKAAVLKYKAKRVTDKSPSKARQAAYNAANAAWDRCLKRRGWRKYQ